MWRSLRSKAVFGTTSEAANVLSSIRIMSPGGAGAGAGTPSPGWGCWHRRFPLLNFGSGRQKQSNAPATLQEYFDFHSTSVQEGGGVRVAHTCHVTQSPFPPVFWVSQWGASTTTALFGVIVGNT